jgi:UDP-N-acetylmuramyl-tripeptide synthetase
MTDALRGLALLSALSPDSKFDALPDYLPADVTDDSREVAQGDAFVASQGSARDGHDFIPVALRAGASMILCERWSADHEALRASAYPTARAMVIPDLRARLPDVARAFYGDPSAALQVVGVTGTNGKTTTTTLIEALGRSLGVRTGLIGTIAHRFPGFEVVAQNTTPGALLLQRLLRRMVDAQVRWVAMEVSSHALVMGRADALSFDAAIWTQFGQDHLDFHKTLAAYRDAKLRLFDDLLPQSSRRGKRPVALVNAEDATCAALFTDPDRVARLMDRVKWYSTDPAADADVQALDVSASPDGQSGFVRVGDERWPFVLPLHGRFNLQNALAAVGAACALGASPAEVVAALASLPQVPGRMQRVNGPGQPQVVVDYAHTPEALRAAIDALRPFCAGALHVVFGAGGDRDPSKRPLMGAAAAAADRITITNDNPRSEPPAAIADALLAGVPLQRRPVVVVDLDRASAIRRAISGAAPDDLVLIAGKGHEDYQIIGAQRLHFDDRAAAADALRAWAPPDP